MTAPSRAIYAVILAAGASSRMGRPKALLPFGELTALELIVRSCVRAGAAGAVVVGGCEPGPVREAADRAGARFILNSSWERGQTSSLLAGLAALPAEADGFLLCPVDCPLALPATIARLLAAPAAAAVAVPLHGGRRGHPALFRRATFAEFLALGEDDPAFTVVRRDPSRVLEIEVEDAGTTLPLDTPEDYRTALERFARRPRSD